MKKNFSKLYYEITLLFGLACLMTFGLDALLSFLPDYASGLMLGLGVSMLIASLVILLNKHFMQKLKVYDQDEREQYIQAKSFTTMYYFHLILSIGVIIITGLFEKTMLFSILCAGMLFIEIIFMSFIRYVYARKY